MAEQTPEGGKKPTLGAKPTLSLRGGAAGAARLAGAAGAGAAAAASDLPSAPGIRRFLTSTTTCLLRPWLKLCRTTPVSVRGLSDSVDFPTLSVLPSGVLVSDIQFRILSVPIAAGATLARAAGAKALQARKSRQKRVICRPGKQGCMYHI